MNKDFQVKLERLRHFLQIFADQHESIYLLECFLPETTKTQFRSFVDSQGFNSATTKC